MLLFPEEYALSTAEDNEHGRRRLAVRRLWECPKKVKDFLWGAGSALCGPVEGLINAAVDAAVDFAQAGWNAITTTAKTALNWLKGLADDIFSKIGEIGGFISTVSNLILDWMTEVKAWLITKLQDLGSFAVESIGALWEAIINSLDDMLGTVGLDRATQTSLISSLGATPWTTHTSGAVLRFCYPSLICGAKKGTSPLVDDTLNLNLGQVETAALRQQLDNHRLTSGESAGQKVRITSSSFKMCFSLDTFQLDFSNVGAYFGCLAEHAWSLVTGLFNAAKQAVQSVINMLSDAIGNGVQAVIGLVENMVRQIKSKVSEVINHLGRRLEDVNGPIEQLKVLLQGAPKHAIPQDLRKTLLDMLAQVEDLQTKHAAVGQARDEAYRAMREESERHEDERRRMMDPKETGG